MKRALFVLAPLSALSLLVGLGCSSGSSGDGAGPGTAGASNSGAGASSSSGSGQGGGANAAAGSGNSSSQGGTAGAGTGAGGIPGGGAGTGAAGSAGMGAGGSAGAAGAGTAGSAGTGAGGSAGATSTGGSAGSTGAAGGPTMYPTPATDHRAIGVHDPSMMQVGSAYYLFATGGKLNVRSSTNLSTWSNAGSIFSALPGWIATELGQTITDLWAPDISLENGTYRVYYAGSVFGSNHSVIGLATNTTLDSKNAAYKWVDQGLVIESNKTGGTSDNWNAIDPNFVKDESGNDWLVFGSFWSGIKLRRIDPATGKVSSADTTLYSLANYSGGIEASSIVFHNGYYYLFVSFDACCKGVNSTYRTTVGRSTAITGPYADNTGKAMLQGGALQMLATDGRYIGPGGGTAFRDGSLYYYVYHYYDGNANGASYLMMRPIAWSADDWPMFSAPLWQ
jgi:arabinan endo-1,5-alpha-L-arabinosidase